MATKDEDFVTTLFVANTHTALLFFTTEGMVYTLKMLAAAARRPQRPRQGDRQHPADPAAASRSPRSCRSTCRRRSGRACRSIFATSDGDVRRNALDDFTNVMRNGKIAMKLPDGVRLINARIASEDDDVMLTTRNGRAIRFPATDVRVFKGRDFDRRPRHPPRPPATRWSRWRSSATSRPPPTSAPPTSRCAAPSPAPAEEEVEPEEGEEAAEAPTSDSFELGQTRYVEMSEAEDLLLTVTANGAGKLSSSHDYPVRGRGGQGVAAMDRAMRGGPLVALFPVEIDDQVMLATDAGQSIRVPVADISFRSRARRRRPGLLHRRRRARRLGGADRRERRGRGSLTRRLRIGLVGLGMAVTPHARGLLDLAAEVEVAAAYSPTAARRAAFAARFPFPLTDDLDALLADPAVDAVMILTPPNTHGELVARSRRRRQAHPAGEAARDLDRPRRGAGRRRRAGRRHPRRRAAAPLPPRRRAPRRASGRRRARRDRLLLDDDPSLAPAGLLRRPGRGTLARDGGGVLLTQGIHTLDLMLSLAGPVAEVTGYATTTAVHRMETEDLACAAVRFASGALGVIDATTAAYPGFPERIELACTRATAALTGGDLPVAWHDGRTETVAADSSAGGTGADPMAFSHEGHRAVLADFLRAIRTRAEPRVSGREALRVHRLIDAILESARSGRPQAVA